MAVRHDNGASAFFPLTYYVGFLRLLARDPRIEVITYADLDWQDDYDYEGSYPEERARWYEAHADDEKIYVFLQHDVDSRPDRTLRVLREEDALGLRSATMVFNRIHDRMLLAREKKLEFLDYGLPIDEFKQLEQERGFVFAYHSNAYEHAMWDMDKAVEVFREDVAQLEKVFDIRFFSPHGGVPGPDGLNNHHVELPDDLRERVRWVANRNTLWIDRSYSDGGILNPNRSLDDRDLRDFVRTWQPGKRYRVLTHPQYFSDAAVPDERLAVSQWYRDLFDGGLPDPHDLWEDVTIGGS